MTFSGCGTPTNTDEEEAMERPAKRRIVIRTTMSTRPCVRLALREFWRAVQTATAIAENIAQRDASLNNKPASPNLAFEVFQQLTPDIDFIVPPGHRNGVYAKRLPLESEDDKNTDSDLRMLPSLTRQPSPEVEAVPSLPPLRLKWRVRTFLPSGQVLEGEYADTPWVRSWRCLTERNAWHKQWASKTRALCRLGLRMPADSSLTAVPCKSVPVTTKSTSIDSTLRRINCPVCFKTFRQRGLPAKLNLDDETDRIWVNRCGHVLCYDCLQAMEKAATSQNHILKCPECRQRMGQLYELRL
eukprot:Gregarina_sp_Poly_1__863@NODE_1205_length_4786_cov_414_183725_g825_i0_p3_GENE_NODE_1205_length_4786_cov_414_183725_g825_i0NODE_1205_length_4786_cov_414_183725_g825_i0_p3_ORF_typecomplete_len300_score27_82zfRING_5/PF14634_6/3_6e10ProkRING_4/PF14447_6/63ProkRING_4/PF14447_6/8_7e08zfRING_UBOX/PF13445_6/2_1e03zfRING_UBOX/PF13445_6/6_5e08zfC3HC4/PF00097_25/2_8e06zfC3HC4_3/PF13920_6/69zfC3HC4_3/PF13920_6/9_9e06zfRING_2/PF13639_6/91zfRING_2/PF13639_6/2_7e05zfANAPC11/PF12861_7/9_1e05zfC3HC4_2/PF13923_6/